MQFTREACVYKNADWNWFINYANAFHIFIQIEVIFNCFHEQTYIKYRMFFFFFISVARPKRICHYMELKNCVAQHMVYLMEFHTIRNNKSITAHCNCLQNCADSNIFINDYKALEDSGELLGTIGGIVVIREYPLVRYRRKILFSLTDLFGKF